MNNSILLKVCKNFDDTLNKIEELLPLAKTLYPDNNFTFETFSDMLKSIFAEKYQMAIFIDESNNKICAFGGGFVRHSLAWGKYFYSGDIVILPEYRKYGIFKRYVNFLHDTAAIEKCNSIHGDSNMKRTEAIKIYEALGWDLVGYHIIVPERK